jgi:hypothetical protein
MTKPKRPKWSLIFKCGKIPARITLSYLRRRGACSGQVKLFTKTFPAGMDLTAENLLKARKARLSIEWLVEFIVVPPTKQDDVEHAFCCWFPERKPHADFGPVSEWIRSLAHHENSERLVAVVREYRKWEAKQVAPAA